MHDDTLSTGGTHVPEKPKPLVKTSIYVPDDLHAELRIYTAKQPRGTSLNDVMVEACRAFLKARRVAGREKKAVKTAPPAVPPGT
jgi:hypothetical protein